MRPAIRRAGAQIEELLEQQFCGANASVSRALLPSARLRYTYTAGLTGSADCTRRAVSSLTLRGVPMDPTATYRVTVGALLADGGDGFPVMREGTGRVTGPCDVGALATYLGGGLPVTPPALDRITRVP